MNKIIYLVLIWAVGGSFLYAQRKGEYPDPQRFEEYILSIEQQDSIAPPPPGAVVCTGSSSMRMWQGTIREDLAPLTVIPRGFGGSTMHDLLYYADRIVLKYAPRAILVYEGDNDVAAGVSPKAILKEMRAFVSHVHEKLPGTRIYFLAVKPSLARWSMWPKMEKVNELMEKECAGDTLLTYIDVASGMLNAEGSPLKDIFIGDGLHMNRKGYLIWRKAVRPVLVKGEMMPPGGDVLPLPFRVVPQLRHVRLLQDEGLRGGGLGEVHLAGTISRPVMGDILSQLTDSCGKSKKGSLLLMLDDAGIAPASPEGYLLKIYGGNAVVIARGEAGLFYGCQTLEQLLEDARDTGQPVPACEIVDYPAMSYRAVHFDVKHHLDHMDYYYRSIDRLARYKINAVIFEFEDKLRYRRQPLVGAPQAISIDEMAALTRYARKRHIEITPLVQGLGHATFILKHPEYAALRELPYNRWAFCPMDSGTYKVLFDMYLDAMEATPGSRYLHIGGDEIGNIGLCPRCKPYADKYGVMALNNYWFRKVSEFVLAHGRIPIFWDDMPLKEAGVYPSTYDPRIDRQQAEEMWKEGADKLEKVVEEIPPSSVFMRWNYEKGTLPGNIMALDWYRRHDVHAMIATATQSSGNALFPMDDRDKGIESRGVIAIKSFVEVAAEKGVDGMLCTAWDDRSPHMETYWRGFIASAEYSWSPGRRSLEEFDEAYLQKEYGLTISQYHDLYARLRNAAFLWEYAYNRQGKRMDLENALFNLPGLAHWMPPKKPGAPEKTDFTDRIITLPDPGHPGAWSEQYRERLQHAEEVMKEYEYTSRKLDSLYRCSEMNRYHWQLFSAINDFQITAPRLLLALKKCDTGDTAAQKEGKKAVEEALQGFDKAWKHLQDVYAETRFIAYPPGYLPDRYFHFASQREDLTWMIQPEELFFPMVKEWIKNVE